MALNRIPDEIDRSGKDRKKSNPQEQTDVLGALSHVLADTYNVYLKTQYYHWNVVGEQFYSLHRLFEKQYKSLASAVDRIAERIRALDASSPGTFKEFQSLSCLKEDTTLPQSWQQMVKNLITDHEHLIACSNKAMDVADAIHDKVTEDLMIKRSQSHEKIRWMLESTLA